MEANNKNYFVAGSPEGVKNGTGKRVVNRPSETVRWILRYGEEGGLVVAVFSLTRFSGSPVDYKQLAELAALMMDVNCTRSPRWPVLRAISTPFPASPP